MRTFLLILAVAGVCTLLGAAVGAGIAWISPEFIVVALRFPIKDPIPVGVALGAVCGGLLGAGLLIVGLALTALNRGIETWRLAIERDSQHSRGGVNR